MSDLATRAQTQLAPVAGQLDPMTIAKVFRASGMFPDIQSEAAAATKIIIGRGLGLTDYDAMSGLHIIKGKAVLAANLMAAAIKRSGKYDYRVTEHTDAVCTIDFYGGGVKIGSTSFSIEDAKRAGLGGDNWKKYARAMLFARCISMGYRTHCPDALGAAPVYVEAHGESEIPEEPKAISPAAMREMTREERREDVRKLLDSGKAETPAPQPKGDDTFTIPKNAKIARVKGPKGDVWRVDVEGHAPIAVKEPTIASGIEANLAFEEPTLVRLEHDGKREIVMEIIKQEVMA
jgi:hypothetical protein